MRNVQTLEKTGLLIFNNKKDQNVLSLSAIVSSMLKYEEYDEYWVGSLGGCSKAISWIKCMCENSKLFKHQKFINGF